MPLDPDLAQAVRAILAESTTLTLATVEADGSPRATPLFFAFEPDLSLIFLSEPATPHIRNLERAPLAAVSVYPPVDGWQAIRGLQLKGEIKTLAPPERAEALAAYRQRFPFVDELADALEASQLYRFSPRWIRLIDNRQGFGYKREVQL